MAIARRLNSERFAWEETQVRPCNLSAGDVTFDRFVGGNDGSAVSQGRVHNRCDYRLNAVIDVFATASRDGPVIMDGPSIFVRDLPPGEVKEITAKAPNARLKPIPTPNRHISGGLRSGTGIFGWQTRP